MRHYGKDGPQCRPRLARGKGPVQTCRLVARNLLFGRVPRGAVVFIGLGVVLVALVFGMASIGALDTQVDSDFHRDHDAALIIKR